MRHRKKTIKLGRNGSHRRCLWANMLKSLIENGRMETTVIKAKALRSHADKMITLAKKNTLAARRAAIAEMMVRFNPLTPKEQRAAKEGNTAAYNGDRQVVGKLFGELRERFEERNGGYTRVTRTRTRTGDGAEMAIIEWV